MESKMMSPEKIKVSVVVPVYNSMPYLVDCIESLIHQTLRSIEIIFVDDKGTDDSVRIIEEYQKKDDRILLLHNEKNVGAGASRNHGISKAIGEYLSVLDADDVFEKDMLESMYKRAVDTDADIVICDYIAMDNMGNDKFERRIPIWFEKRWIKDDYIQDQDNHCYITALLGGVAWNKLIRTKLIKDNHLCFQEIHNCDDVLFSFTSMLKANRIVYLGKNSSAKVHYRKGGDNSQNNNVKDPATGFIAAYAIMKYVNDQKMEAYRKAAFSVGFSSILFWTERLNTNQRTELSNMLAKGEIDLNEIEAWKESDFFSIKEREALKRFVSNDSEAFEERLSYLLMSAYERDELWDILRKGSFALWGYGLYGRRFLIESERKKYNIKCIVDKSSKVIGTTVGQLVVQKPSKSVFEGIDGIVVTNSNYTDSVLADLKEMNCKVPIIDIAAFCRFGISFEECIYRWYKAL